MIYECQAHSARVQGLLCPRRNQGAPFSIVHSNRWAARVNPKVGVATTSQQTDYSGNARSWGNLRLE